MLRVHFVDGLELQGETYSDVVKKLRATSFNKGKDINEYMNDVKRRTKIQTGKSIDYTDHESFIKELHRVGVIVNIENR